VARPPVRIDLHTHSAASDGTEPPAEVVRRAAVARLDVLALTDHDTFAGIPAAAAALPPGMTLLPGVEISCVAGGIPLHLLGLLVDPTAPTLTTELALIREDRVRRAEVMVERLVALGAPVSWDHVTAIAGAGAVVGRPHVARALVASGAVPDLATAFSDSWLGPGGPAYVGRRALPAVRAVRLVRAAGGVPVFAHPGADRRGAVVGDEVVAELAQAGLAALEVDHPDHDERARLRLRRLAAELGLPVTGASDDHGRLTGHRLGVETTDPDALEQLVAQAANVPLQG